MLPLLLLHVVPRPVSLQIELGDELRFLVEVVDRVRAVGIGHGMHGFSGVGDRVDQVPDQFPLHLPAGLRHVDVHHADRLEAELQVEDVVAEGNVLGPRQFPAAGQDLVDVVATEGFALLRRRCESRPSRPGPRRGTASFRPPPCRPPWPGLRRQPWRPVRPPRHRFFLGPRGSADHAERRGEQPRPQAFWIVHRQSIPAAVIVHCARTPRFRADSASLPVYGISDRAGRYRQLSSADTPLRGGVGDICTGGPPRTNMLSASAFPAFLDVPREFQDHKS